MYSIINFHPESKTEYLLLKLKVGHGSVGWKEGIGTISSYPSSVTFNCSLIFSLFEKSIPLLFGRKR